MKFAFKKYTLPEKMFVIFIYVFLFLFGLLCFFPFLTVLARSFSPEFYIQQGQVILFPVKWTLNAYQKVFQAKQIVTGFKNSLFVAVVGTTINLVFSFAIAYPLSRKRLPLRRTFTVIVVFTMLLPVAIIPLYLLVRSLKLLNSLWALIWPYAITTFNMIIIKNYFEGIPESLEESALLDGAGELTILTKIFLPLSRPVIAAIGLFYLIYNWNIFMPAVFFLTHPSKYTIQVVLKDIISQQMLADMLPYGVSMLQQSAGPQGIQSAVTIITMIPVLVIYPFIQKYFTSGLMVGSVKG
ncbi:MAG: carbohydrate ABC transporter permease [Spirochaetales bacterium]|nr:carbohydrate ABC transporter permease [Spirochaetales bacterium]